MDDESVPHLAWGATGDATPVLQIAAPSRGDHGYTIQVDLILGSLSGGWSEGPLLIGPGETAEVPLRVGEDAWLHDEAGRYLTSMTVTVFVDGDEPVGLGSLKAPDLFVAWPDGGDAPPVAWSRDEKAWFAPFGVTDPELHAQAARLGEDVWVMPPLRPIERTTDRVVRVDDELRAGIREVTE